MGKNFFNVPPGGGGGGVSNPLDTITSLEYIKNSRLQQEQRKQEMERASRADVNLAEDRLRQQKERDTTERETAVNKMGQEVYGIDPATDPSIKPFMGPASDYIAGTAKTQAPIPGSQLDPAREGMLSYDKPMDRADYKAKVLSEKPKYEAAVKAAVPTFQDSSVDPATGKRTANDPATAVAERAKIFPVSPKDIGKTVEQQAQSGQEQVKLRTGQFDEPLAERRSVAATTTAEEKAKQGPIDTAIKEAEKTIAQTNAKYAEAKDKATIDHLNAVTAYNRLHVQDLTETRDKHNKLEAALKAANHDPKKLVAALADFGGSSGAEFLVKDAERRSNVALSTRRAIKDDLGLVHKSLDSLDVGKHDAANIAAIEASVNSLNLLESSYTDVTDSKSTTVYSLWRPSKDEKPLFGKTDIPREVKQRMDNNQLDMGNPQDFSWFVKSKLAAVRNNKTYYVRGIEQLGQQFGVPQQVVDDVKGDYLTEINSLKLPKAKPTALPTAKQEYGF